MARPLQTADADFVRRTHDSFARQQAMTTIGARLESVTAGRVVIAMAHRPELTQQTGYLHAGMLATALDSACGYAAFTLMPAGAEVLTIEFKINLLAPAKGPLFVMDALVTKAGRTISVVDGRAFQSDTLNDGDSDGRKLVATMTATIMTLVTPVTRNTNKETP